MKMYKFAVLPLLLTMQLSGVVQAQSEPISELNWQVGPTTGQIGDKARIAVPQGYVFLDNVDTQKLMVLMENFSSDNEYVLAPSDLGWYALFEFNPVGYVKDDEELDPQLLLETVTRGTEQGNIERRERGWTTMTILGWKFQPRYDSQTKLLEWAFLFKDDQSDSQIINYNTRLLGRKGVMEVVLVAEPETLESSVADFKRLIDGYSFSAGEKYADYRQGDRVAEFGLAALVTGGVAAVATKKGLWPAIVAFLVKGWKLLAAVAIGISALFGSLFRKKS